MSMKSGAENFLSIENSQKFFFTKCMVHDEFSEPPGRADSKNPIFIFCRLLGQGHLRGLGSVSVGFWGAHQWCLFLEGGV